MKNQVPNPKLVSLISFIVLLITMSSCSKQNDKIEIFLVENAILSQMEIEPQSVVLGSKIISEEDIINYNKSTFTFNLTSESSSRLEKMDLEGKAFCIVKNGQKLLVGWFWECSSSLGMNGFVTFDFACLNRKQFELGYCLGPKEYPNENDPRKEITIANTMYN